ncbi:MAG: patatin-like phospholipase family protein, partial [Acidobacteriota bacterium]
MADLPGLIVLADGVQAAFAAGVVAELERSGVHWREGVGAGLGAQVAALALLGEAGEAERRWLRQADLGCPLLRSRLENGLRRHPSVTGLLILPDLLTMSGWLDPEELEEYLAPEAAGLPVRLTARGARLWVAVEDLRAAARKWVEISTGEALAAAVTLRAAASFTGGWPPVEEEQPGGAVLSGGVGALPARLPEWEARAGFAVCGFPVPAVARPAAPANLIEILQRREETAAAEVWSRA